MALGKAAVFKHIPVYYPDHVGAAGGVVGAIGGLGGFVLPLTFGVLTLATIVDRPTGLLWASRHSAVAESLDRWLTCPPDRRMGCPSGKSRVRVGKRCWRRRRQCGDLPGCSTGTDREESWPWWI